ncbi:MAG TPA: GNAT family N-acetyltransferase [Devosia sp.]|nr:GNAT family N-acetyltransferase [Devosia sp.]
MHVGDEALFQRIAPEVFDEPIHPERLKAYLSAPGHMMVLAFEGDLVVGQCAGVLHRHPDKPTELYIDEVGTASTHLRRGIARMMMDELFAWGRELGCEEAWLGTETDNEPAKALYRRYRPTEDETIQYFLFAL